MDADLEKNSRGQGGEKGKDLGSSKSTPHDDSCRCKETSEMSPGELLKLMISDLAFWKKKK